MRNMQHLVQAVVWEIHLVTDDEGDDRGLEIEEGRKLKRRSASRLFRA